MDKIAMKMKGKWTKFCPKCGKTTDELFESVCKECFTADIKLIDPEQMNITISKCKHCGGYFKGKERTNIEDAVADSVRKELKRKCDCKINELKIDLIAEEDRTRAVLNMRTELKGVELEETGEIEVSFNTGLCETCNRIASGYYAGIVQLRADDRFPMAEEMALAEKIAYSVLDKSDFISKETTLKEGLDIYVSSIDCGRKISRGIVDRIGGSFSESSKLYGRKDGRNIYRVSFSVRLPEFKEGTVLRIGDKTISVVRMIKGKGIECVDVNTQERVLLRKQETKKLKFP